MNLTNHKEPVALSVASLEGDLKTLYTSNVGWMLARSRRFSDSTKDAEEAVQETFARFFERADPATIANVPAYLTRSLDNVIRARRRGAARFELAVDPSDSCFERQSLVWNSEHSEVSQDVSTAMKRLKPRHRRVLTLLSEGVPPREIGQILGINGQAARALLTRARSNARRLLRDDFAPVITPLAWIKRMLSRAAVVYQRLPELALYLGALQTAMLVGSLLIASTANQFQTISVSGNEKGPSGTETITTFEVNRSSTYEIATRAVAGVSEIHPEPWSTIVRANIDNVGYVDLAHEDGSNPNQPSPLEKLINLLENPENIPLPSCGGTLNCPQPKT